MTRFGRTLFAVPALMLLQAQLGAPALGASPHQSAAATSPRKLALTAADINAAFGGGFTRLGATGLSAMGPGMANLAIVKGTGYVTGYEMMFQRQHPAPLMVNTGVNLLRSKAFARAAIARVIRVYGTPSGRREGVDVTRTASVGDSAILFSFSTTESGRTFRERGYLFSRGPYDGEVLAIGTAVPAQSTILSLARVLDTRIQRG